MSTKATKGNVEKAPDVSTISRIGGGAMLGTVVGTAVGAPVGTIVGAVIGGAVGAATSFLPQGESHDSETPESTNGTETGDPPLTVLGSCRDSGRTAYSYLLTTSQAASS